MNLPMLVKLAKVRSQQTLSECTQIAEMAGRFDTNVRFNSELKFLGVIPAPRLIFGAPLPLTRNRPRSIANRTVFDLEVVFANCPVGFTGSPWSYRCKPRCGCRPARVMTHAPQRDDRSARRKGGAANPGSGKGRGAQGLPTHHAREHATGPPQTSPRGYREDTQDSQLHPHTQETRRGAADAGQHKSHAHKRGGGQLKDQCQRRFRR